MLHLIRNSCLILAGCFVLILISTFLTSCKEDEAKPSPVITNVSPDKGRVGATVIITGDNFSVQSSGNEVKFNNITAVISSASKTSITVTVPEGATTGPLTVTADGQIATFPTFTVLAEPPAIASISPATGLTGTEVVITGSNFNSVAASNTVAFNGAVALVQEATETSLTVIVPANASSGKITVTVNGETAISATDFIVTPQIENFTPVIGAVNTVVTITGSGFALSADANEVAFNGVIAEVISSTAQELTVKVPVGATTGMVTVTSGGNTAEGSDFHVVVEAIRSGGSGYDMGFAIAVDAAKNTYVAGSFQNQITFGTTVLNATSEDGFLAKYNGDGELIWAKQLTGDNVERIMDVEIDSQGDVYISGYISSSNVTFAALNASASGYDAFIVRINAAGDPIWIKTLSTTNTDVADAVGLDNSDGLYVAGSFNGTMVVGDTTLTSNGDSDAFVVKYNKNSGDPVWARAFGDGASSIDVTEDAVYVSGGFFKTLEVAGIAPMETRGELDGFVVKLDLSGAAIWATQIGGADWDFVNALVVDQNGDCIAGGYFIGSTTVGNTGLTAAGGEEIFLAKLQAGNGNEVWAKSAGGSNYDVIRSLTVDALNNIYATGEIQGPTATFDDLTIEADNYGNAFVAQYTSSGDVEFVKHGGSADTDTAQSVAIDSDGVIYVTGSYRGATATFGVTELENAGGDDIFLWKIWQ